MTLRNSASILERNKNDKVVEKDENADERSKWIPFFTAVWDQSGQSFRRELVCQFWLYVPHLQVFRGRSSARHDYDLFSCWPDCFARLAKQVIWFELDHTVSKQVQPSSRQNLNLENKWKDKPNENNSNHIDFPHRNYVIHHRRVWGLDAVFGSSH